MTLDLVEGVATAVAVWDAEVVPTLREYIRIPNVSAAYDAEWERNGHMERAVALIRDWCASRPIDGLAVDVSRLPGRSPVIVIEVPATVGGADRGTVLLYGHLDKQPPMDGWREGLGPWEPVLEDGRLFGRGGADDGYSAFAALTAIEAVRAGGGEHGRCVVLIEASEESGSPDLPAHVEALADRIGAPDLVVCLDSGCATYDRLWVTTSLRGNLIGVLTVRILTEGVHSGAAGGVVPSTFRILRGLLDRVEDVDTGAIVVPELTVEIPDDRLHDIERAAADLGDAAAGRFPWVEGAGPGPGDAADRLRAKTWRASLSVTGIDGIPRGAEAGNVLRPLTSATLSFRLPPTADADTAAAALTKTLAADPPYGAQVTFDVRSAESGWNAPRFAPWLAAALDDASTAVFGGPAGRIGEGGTIPFMGMLGARFPEAQFVITGVLGPGSNAHGPNEFLDIATGQRVTACVAAILDAHASRAP